MLRAVLREIKGYWKTTWKYSGYSKVLFNVHRVFLVTSHSPKQEYQRL